MERSHREDPKEEGILAGIRQDTRLSSLPGWQAEGITEVTGSQESPLRNRRNEAYVRSFKVPRTAESDSWSSSKD